MKRISGIKRTAVIAALLSVSLGVSACDDDSNASPGDGDETPPPTALLPPLPTGPLPDRVDYPDYDYSAGAVIDDTLWIWGEMTNEEENVLISQDLGFRMSVRPDMKPGQFDFYTFPKKTYRVEPGRTLPIVRNAPVTDFEQDLSEFWVLLGEHEPERPQAEEWAHPWDEEPIAQQSITRSSDLGDMYHVKWDVSFIVGDSNAPGVILCHDPNGHVVGGSLGVVEPQGEILQTTVAVTSNNPPDTVQPPEETPRIPNPTCVFHPGATG